jgi:hypothetical protein
MKYEIPLMLKQGGGAIVNTSSGAGVKGFKGGAAYVAAKHGVVGLTKAAALDYGVKHPHQRCVPRDHRHAHDAAIQRGHPRRKTGGDCAGTGRKNGNAGRDRCVGCVVMFGCG